jgi:hypothetical protein
MDSFNIQVMLRDGNITDYEVRNSRKNKDTYEVLEKGRPVAVFNANSDGTWTVTENAAGISEDLVERIGKQLTGFHT